MEKDPKQFTNLAGDEDHAKVVAELRERRELEPKTAVESRQVQGFELRQGLEREKVVACDAGRPSS